MSKRKRRSTSAQQASSKKKQKTASKLSFNWTWLIAGLAVAVIAIGAIWYFTQGNTSTAAYPKEISVAQAYAKYEAGAFLLDVRTPEEWVEYHVPKTTLIPLDELEGRVSALPRDQEIVVVCRSGNRSQEGRDILLKAGFTQVTSMAGGLTEWQAAGYPTITGP